MERPQGAELKLDTLIAHAKRQHANSTGDFWLLAFPHPFSLTRCNQSDTQCMTVQWTPGAHEGDPPQRHLFMPFGAMKGLGAVDVVGGATYMLLLVALPVPSGPEVVGAMDTFADFAKSAGAELLARRPDWFAANFKRLGAAAETWGAALMFNAPERRRYVEQRGLDGRPAGELAESWFIIRQPWARSFPCRNHCGTRGRRNVCLFGRRGSRIKAKNGPRASDL
jgi:hypothetical protein